METKNKSPMCRSWFCVFNNPEEHGFTGTPQEICDKIVEIWTKDNPTRTCAVIYCLSAEELKHLHAIFEDTKNMRFSVIKKLFPSMHIEPTKGNKEQAEDYINKRGKFEEKGEKIICKAQYGEIKGAQGQRKELEQIEELLELGKTPSEILEASFRFYRYETMIKKRYFAKRDKETPIVRDVAVYWHVGYTGTGKSYSRVQLAEQHGEDSVYTIQDYGTGQFDNYCGQKYLILDEFRGQIRFSSLLTILDKYKCEINARYSNVKGLWDEVHICSILPPEDVYEKMVSENKNTDVYLQLTRRINKVIYHYKENEKYYTYEVDGLAYEDYNTLRYTAMDNHIYHYEIGDLSDFEDFEELIASFS